MPKLATLWEGAGITFLGAKTANVGQNNKNPFPAFTNHVVVRIGESIYDPSYGVAYDKVGAVTAAQAFEAATVGAWGAIEQQNNGLKTILLLRLPTAGATELVVVPQPEE